MRPDQRKCEYSFITTKKETPPSIAFTPTALKWIRAIVNCHSEEVGFLGVVNEIDGSYVITEIFYPKHCLASYSTCEISPEGEIEIAQQLINENRPQDISKIRFWGHSHHTMGTTPSVQDDNQAIDKMNKCGAYFIRAIANKEEEMSVSFFDYKRQLKFENIKWTVAFDCSSVLSNITSIINMESTAKEKIQLIKNAVCSIINFKDDEYNEIEKKVLELKKKQIPKSDSFELSKENVKNLCRQDYFRHVYQPNFSYTEFNRYNESFSDNWRSKDKKKNKKNNLNQIQPLLMDSEMSHVVDNIWSREG